MNDVLTAVLRTSLGISAVVVLLLLLNRALGDRLSATFRRSMWLVVVLGLLVPARPDIPLPFDPPPLPAIAEFSPARSPLSGVPAAGFAAAVPSARGAWDSGLILSGIWAAGAVAVLAFHLRSYLAFAAAVRRWGKDAGVRRAGRKTVAVKTCAFASSPMLIGFFNPVIVLPERAIPPDELECVLRHEMEHHRRGDVWANLLVLLSLSIHWFNPLVHLMARAFRADCEAACDGAAVAGNSMEGRRRYGEAIIGFIGSENRGSPVLSTYFFGGSKAMKKRLESIMDTGRKSAFLSAACAAFVVSLTLLSGSAFAASDGGRIGEDRARAIALEHAGVAAGDATFLRVRPDRDDGRDVYDVEFYSGDTEYDYEIDAASGEITGFDRDIENHVIPSARGGDIGGERAKQIALEHAGLAESQAARLRVRLDRDDGRAVYDVKFRGAGRTKYSYEIDAATGAILESDFDRD